MNLIPKALILVLVSACLFSCTENDSNKVFKYNAVGSPGDILTIVNEDLWQSEIGDTIKNYLQAEYELLPQSEPKFRLVQMPPASLVKTTKRSRNILIAKVSKEFNETGVKKEYDKWAKPQLVITAKAHTKKDLINLISKNGKAITSAFEKETLKRLAKSYYNTPNKRVMSKLREKFNIDMVIPKHFYIDKEQENFIWVRNETPKLSQVILIWTDKYKKKSQLSLNRIIEVRDSVSMLHVPGPNPETSFMTSEKRIMPIYSTRKLNGNFCAEVRGLWRVEGGFMGGPFINYSIVDKPRNRIVTVDVFVYAGRQDKRFFIRELEAMVNTLKFTK